MRAFYRFLTGVGFLAIGCVGCESPDHASPPDTSGGSPRPGISLPPEGLTREQAAEWRRIDEEEREIGRRHAEQEAAEAPIAAARKKEFDKKMAAKKAKVEDREKLHAAANEQRRKRLVEHVKRLTQATSATESERIEQEYQAKLERDDPEFAADLKRMTDESKADLKRMTDEIKKKVDRWREESGSGSRE